MRQLEGVEREPAAEKSRGADYDAQINALLEDEPAPAAAGKRIPPVLLGAFLVLAFLVVLASSAYTLFGIGK